MAKQAYIERRFRPATIEVLEQCEAILDEYAADGLDLTLRQLYYQMVARDLLPEEWADEPVSFEAIAAAAEMDE